MSAGAVMAHIGLYLLALVGLFHILGIPPVAQWFKRRKPPA